MSPYILGRPAPSSGQKSVLRVQAWLCIVQVCTEDEGWVLCMMVMHSGVLGVDVGMGALECAYASHVYYVGVHQVMYCAILQQLWYPRSSSTQ